MHPRDREEEAKRALKRLEAESEKMLGATPSPEPTEDRVELLARRVARILSVFLAAGLLFYLWITYLKP
jgi:hypothetical protein